MAVWADATTIWSVAKDVTANAIPPPKVLMSTIYVSGLTLQPDGIGGFLLLLGDCDHVVPDERCSQYVARLSGDGTLLN